MRKSVCNYFVLIILTHAVVGCVASHTATAPDVRKVKYPELDREVTAGLGERLLESGLAIKVYGFSLQNDVDIFDGTVKAGIYHQIGLKDEHRVFGPAHGVGTGTVSVFSGLPSPAKPYVDSSSGYLCFLGGVGTRFCSDDIKPNVRLMNIYTPDSFMQELIYTGKVDNKIRFKYREYSNGMARESYNVDVEYDLNDGHIISYKGSNIEILEANNTKITYKVITHFNSN
ncbi:hypothetical protein CWE22_10700 [Pseudidiomarina aestuarii]|uniref:Lipoprotein n=1 Tax=Pseudidiomarina aestuarii TaxID=624146 RepID=A0A7Z7EST5_9GAMM|nr:hypothetical protein CWE22_10700 [Pseudidiomarina aestuarii]